MPFLDTNPGQDTRNKIARHMFRVWYVPFYYYGVIHGDPHLGNYSIASDHRINLMDFGSIRLFRPEFVAGVIELYKALRDDDKAQAVDAYERWGFVGLDNEAIDVLNMWADLFMHRFLKIVFGQSSKCAMVRLGATLQAKCIRN